MHSIYHSISPAFPDSPAVESRGHRGYFIVFEGIDCSGKTTQSQMLESCLKEEGIPVTWTQEPRGTQFGTHLDQGRRSYSPIPMAEFFLFAAARSQHVKEVIRPSLDGGDVVICDRYTSSSLAYQGYGRNLDLEVIKKINRLAVGQCVPDVTIYLLLSVKESWARVERRGVEDPLEEKVLHERVSQGYEKLAKDDPTGLVFNGQLEENRLAEKIWDALRQKRICFS